VPEPSQPKVARVDTDLAKVVEERIGSSAEPSGDDVSVEVENAVVRLTGTIDGPSPASDSLLRSAATGESPARSDETSSKHAKRPTKTSPRSIATPPKR